jgi:TolB protein
MGDASPEATGLELAERYPIAFRSHQHGSSSNLYIMTLDGSDVRPVTRGGNYFLPRWSPDGRSLAFRHVTESVNAEAGLVAANGDQPVLLTQGEHVNLWSFAVNWSPDGERLSHGSVRAVTALWVWQMARSGGQQRRLLPEIDMFQREAVWSRSEPPRLAFIDTDRSTIAQDVWVVDPDDASQALNLTHGQIAAPSDVRWSPDGRRLAFAGYPVQADGAVEGAAGHRDAGAFAGQAAPNCEVFVVDVETGELTRVTQSAAYDREPTWSPDGQHLLFASDRVGSDDLWLVALDDPSMVRRLTELDPAYDKTSPDWYWGPR